MSILGNKSSLFKWLATFILGIASCYIVTTSSAGLIPTSSVIIPTIILFAMPFIYTDEHEELPNSNTGYSLVAAFFAITIFIYKSEILLDTPVRGASGFTLGERYDKSLAAENLTYIGSKKNFFMFNDTVKPEMSVSVYVDHKNLVYKIEHSFDFSAYESQQRTHLTDILESTVLKNHNASNSAFWYGVDIYDGKNSIFISRGFTLNHPTVIFTNEHLEDARESFASDTDVAELKKKLNFMSNT